MGWKTSKQIDRRIEIKQRQQTRVAAQLVQLQGIKNARDKRRDVRRAFIVGEAVMAHRAAHGPAIAALEAILDEQVTKPGDRAMIADLLGVG